MNALKALAKMTKLAARLETENVDLRRSIEVSQKRELSIGDQVAVQRVQLRSLEAKLYAAEQRAEVAPHLQAALSVVEGLHYVWSESNGKWYSPPPTPGAPYPSADWQSHAWATHYLHNASLVAPAYVHAELVGGEYFGDPQDNKHGRICYAVGLGSTDWKVLETRPGYAGPLTRSLAPPLADHVPIEPTSIGRPEGGRWRNALKYAPPRNMSDSIEAVRFNGLRAVGPASEFEWGTELPTGVAWWRYDRSYYVPASKVAE